MKKIIRKIASKKTSSNKTAKVEGNGKADKVEKIGRLLFSPAIIESIKSGKFNRKAKREILPAVILSLNPLNLVKKPTTLKVEDFLIKAGYNKEDLYLADTLLSKVSADVPAIFDKRFNGLVIKAVKSKTVPENLNPVITEIEVSIKK